MVILISDNYIEHNPSEHLLRLGCMVSTASLANIGGSASAPIVATAYDPSYAGIGVLMGVLGAAIGNFAGLGMGALLQLFV